MKYKGIDKDKILEVQQVKLLNTDVYVKFTKEKLEEICKGTDSFEQLYKGIENQLKARMNDTEMAIICEMAMLYLDSLKDKETTDKEAYNKGLNDAWELVRKLTVYNYREGGYDSEEIHRIYGTGNLFQIFKNYTLQEVLAKLETYEKKQAMFTRGDVVEFIATNDMGIYIGQWISGKHSVVFDDCDVPQEVKTEEIRKTGKHIDIQKILDELKEGNDDV